MSKKNAKLSLKKETLRKLDSLTTQELRAVGGGDFAAANNKGYGLVVPPKGTNGCTTEGCFDLGNYQLDGLRQP